MSTPAGSGKSVLVTGATGVVGLRLVPRLVAAGHRVTATARSAEKRVLIESLGARAVSFDLFDAAAIRRELEASRAEVMINLATHIPSSALKMMLPWSWRENDRVRRDGSAALASAGIEAGVERFIQESFAPVYEDAGQDWIDETGPVRPAPFNRTVLDAERSAARFSEHGGKAVVLRFAGFYGPDALLREMIGMVRRGWSPLPGPGPAYWSSVAQDDAASAAFAALGVAPGTYNVCDDEPLTRSEYATVLAKAVGARPPRTIPSWMTALGGRSMELLSRSQRMSNAKLKTASGWSPRWRSFREGLPAAVRELDPARAARVPGAPQQAHRKVGASEALEDAPVERPKPG